MQKLYHSKWNQDITQYALSYWKTNTVYTCRLSDFQKFTGCNLCLTKLKEYTRPIWKVSSHLDLMYLAIHQKGDYCTCINRCAITQSAGKQHWASRLCKSSRHTGLSALRQSRFGYLQTSDFSYCLNKTKQHTHTLFKPFAIKENRDFKSEHIILRSEILCAIIREALRSAQLVLEAP